MVFGCKKVVISPEKIGSLIVQLRKVCGEGG